MENHGKTTNSDESPPPPPKFEFGSLTPSSPSQDSLTDNSLADHLFFNGRLVPHAFPAASNNSKWSISRTNSEYTSRSNSTNSRSSFGCSSSNSNSSSTSYSPRTNNFNDNNSLTNHKPLDLKPTIRKFGKSVNTMRSKSTETVTASLYRSYSSQRWQYITHPAPVKIKSGVIRVGCRKKNAARMEKAEERNGSRVMKWWRRILTAAIFACRECHAVGGNDDAIMNK